MERHSYVYILTSKRSGTLYIGVTSDLIRRVWEHRHADVPGFAKKYGTIRLVYFEEHATIELAIAREKAMKKWNRAWKLELIEQGNPDWRDLWLEITGSPLPRG